jgi:hypothetical protein
MLMGFTLLLSDFFIYMSSFLGGLPARPDVLNGRRGESCEMRFSVSGFQFSVKKMVPGTLSPPLLVGFFSMAFMPMW